MSSEYELREQIKELERKGFSGATHSGLDTLNRQQTSGLSNGEIVALIHSRASEGKPIGKLAAAARERGLGY